MTPEPETLADHDLPDVSNVVDPHKILEQELENLVNIHKDLEGEILTMLVKRGRIEALIGAVSEAVDKFTAASDEPDNQPDEPDKVVSIN
jgi:hypothetical protein